MKNRKAVDILSELAVWVAIGFIIAGLKGCVM